MSIIYRDDDINRFTDLAIVMKIQGLFDKYKKVHTVAVVMKDLWESRGIWEWLMVTNNINITLHGWEHIDYSKLDYKSIYDDITKSLSYWDRCVERGGYRLKRITTFYPPWNATSDIIKKVCKDLKLDLGVDTINKDYSFHWWEFVDSKKFIKLQEVLKK